MKDTKYLKVKHANDVVGRMMKKRLKRFTVQMMKKT
jgi:hypothetical protein